MYIYTLCPEKGDQQYFVHNFDKFKCINAATLPCKMKCPLYYYVKISKWTKCKKTAVVPFKFVRFRS